MEPGALLGLADELARRDQRATRNSVARISTPSINPAYSKSMPTIAPPTPASRAQSSHDPNARRESQFQVAERVVEKTVVGRPEVTVISGLVAGAALGFALGDVVGIVIGGIVGALAGARARAVS
jgi:hypothetical protein